MSEVQKRVYYIHEPFSPHQISHSVMHDLDTEQVIFAIYDARGYQVIGRRRILSETMVEVEIPYDINWPAEVVIIG